MARLLKDATKISGVSYDMSNLSDVYSAIHVIQEKLLDVTGTTAKEASSTFTGSFNAMKSSAQNVLGAMATGGDVTSAMKALVDSAMTFLLNNAVPMIANVITSIPSAIIPAIKNASPRLKEAGKEIANNIKEGLKAMLPSSMADAVDGAFSNVSNLITKMKPVVTEIGDMFKRVAPIITKTLGGAFENSGNGIDTFVSMISSAIPTVENIIVGMTTAISYVMPVLQSLGSTFMTILPTILTVVSNTITAVLPIIQSFWGAIQTALPEIENIIQIFSGVLSTIFPVVQQIFADLGSKISSVVSEIVVPIVQKLGDIFQKVSPVISSVLSTAWSIISPILDLLMSTFKLVWSILEPIIDKLVDAFVWLWEKLEPIFNGLSKGLSKISGAIGGVADWIGGIFGGDGGSSHAYGLNRVPYDNYPAVLHQGEKVLTRNQADQYDRQMGTRGVQLTEAVRELPRDDGSGTTGTVGKSQGIQEIKNTGTNVTIEKLADTVVIEKEADVDKVVEDMITKFRKLVPNMP